ncbi:hypothetical protein D3C74_450130 [compost metagenome]
MVDEPFPACKRICIIAGAGQRVAKNANRRNNEIMFSGQLTHPCSRLRQIRCTCTLPERETEGFKTMLHDLRDYTDCIRCTNQCSDSKGIMHLVYHSNIGLY